MSVPRFWREIPQRYTLQGTRCPACATTYFPPRPVCPSCRRASIGKMEPLRLNGRGTVVSHTTVYESFGDFALQTPYCLALIRMEEGPVVTAPIIDVDPDAVAIGLPVESCFRKISSDGDAGIIYYGYKFRPVKE